MTTDTDRAKRLAPVNYHCPTHGVWDATKASGCPGCVDQMRHELRTDRAKLALFDEMVEALKKLSLTVEQYHKAGFVTGNEVHFTLRDARAVLGKVKEIS